jgi:hypothetical protein
MTNFRYSATAQEIADVADMQRDLASARSAHLAQYCVDEVAYYPNIENCEGTPRGNVLQIARELQIEVTAEPVPGQGLILAPTALGGVALWRQVVGTTRPMPQRCYAVPKAVRLYS